MSWIVYFFLAMAGVNADNANDHEACVWLSKVSHGSVTCDDLFRDDTSESTRVKISNGF